jgi:hypothetical protein
VNWQILFRKTQATMRLAIAMLKMHKIFLCASGYYCFWRALTTTTTIIIIITITIWTYSVPLCDLSTFSQKGKAGFTQYA